MPLDEPTSPETGHLTEDNAVLGALGEQLSPDEEAHLQRCAQCRGEVAAWARVVGTARSADVVEPVPVPAGTWENIAREVGIDPAPPTARPAGRPDDAPRTETQDPDVRDEPVVRPLRPRTTRSRSPRRWMPVAAAAVIGLGLGVVGTRLATGPAAEPVPSAPRTVVVSSAALEPLPAQTADPGSGRADVTDVDGVRRLDLAVSGVQAPSNGFLEVWLLDADGGLVSLGVMSADRMSIMLPADLDLTRFDVVDVSREPSDGDPGHSSDSVLRGTLTSDA